MNTNKSTTYLKNKIWTIIFSLICLLTLPALAGDLTVDKLTVEDDAVFYSKVVVSQEVAMGSVPTNGQVLYYTFDINENGIVPDQSGNNHTGTVNGATYTSSGRVGGGYSFETTDNIAVPNSAQFDFGTGNFTMAAWIYPKEVNQNVIIGKSSANNQGYLFNQNSYQLQFLAGSGGASWSVNVNSGSYNITINSWNHVVVAQQSGQIYLWINGVASGNGNGGTVNGSAISLLIGDCSWTPIDFNGTIDEVMIYNRVLSSNEIYNLYLYNGTNFPPPSLDVTGNATFKDGVKYTKPIGDLLMGSYTNSQ